MRNTAILVLVFILFSCKSKEGIPDVSNVKVDVRVERFDQEFFALDTNRLEEGINRLSQKYPEMTSIFLQYILGLGNEDMAEGVKHFLRLSGPIRDTVNAVFRNTQDVEKEFLQAFKYVKHYFPKYEVPRIITVVGPVDALAQGTNGPTPNFLRPEFLGLSLQFYLGNRFSVYNDPMFIESVVPSYRSRRFSKEYITADAMQLVVDNLFPDSSNDKPLIEQMIEKGKRWWLLDKFMPHTPDSIKTGYTEDQLKWCRDNEGLIWTYILRQDELYATKPAIIQNYIGEGPFTQGFSQELSPGNLGQWIGWQIMKKFADKYPGKSIEEVMRTSATKILDEAKYRPK